MAANPENVAKAIMAGIDANLHIHDAGHIACDVKTTGFMFWKKTEIRIAGRVDTEKEKAEVDKIIEAESAGVVINNTLRVQRR